MPYKYKVTIKNYSGLFVSFLVAGAAEAVYKINEYVSAPNFLKERGYYLCVFDTLKHAKDFANARDRIFTCEVRGRHRIKKLPAKLDLEKLAEGKIQPEANSNAKYFPEGTEMWEWVKLIEEVR